MNIKNRIYLIYNIIIIIFVIFHINLNCINCEYVVSVERLNTISNPLPSINSQKGDSIFKWNYNSAYVPLFDKENKLKDALLVRCQNNANVSEPYSTTPSKLALTELIGEYPNNIKFNKIEQDNIVFEPNVPQENYGTEDPRVVYDKSSGIYYMLYSAVQQFENKTITCKLSLATTKTPKIKSTWKRHGPLFPNVKWSKSGSMLIRESKTTTTTKKTTTKKTTTKKTTTKKTTTTSYLIYGD